ncbi:hypothetical protein BDR03DRAFT_977115 [Suillus americanus]|nr:hypothetical protein BDR03DRAFT_977115 [Suillus americanus]
MIYWTRSDFNSAKTKSHGVLKWGSNKRKTMRTTDDAESVESNSKGNEKAGALLFLVDKHGKVLSETHQKDICSFQCSIWYTLLSFNLAPVAWSKVDSITQLYYYGCMHTRFPELQLCEGDWKAEVMAVEYYHGWIESKDTKIKGKKSCDPSLALEASRSSSSKCPTSLTVLQSEHAKKQWVLLADGILESSEGISTSITMKKPVPASQPALQFLSMFNNTGARDTISNTSPGTGSSSDSAQSSGKCVTPLSDSVPLPSSSTLAFLATALNNVSLEGSTSPHISPPSATSTGEVLTQPVKKKSCPTNPNNVFKPSSGSTTAHNLCGIKWQAQCKTGTVAEFTMHWNSLTLQQREPYIAHSKLADAAKTNAAEFAVSGP